VKGEDVFSSVIFFGLLAAVVIPVLIAIVGHWSWWMLAVLAATPIFWLPVVLLVGLIRRR
jgi:hypothetical protein